MAVLHLRPRAHGRIRIARPRSHRGFNAGDVGYVPQGYGHYIENIGNEDVELLIALNNGTYESISLADWIGAPTRPYCWQRISRCRRTPSRTSRRVTGSWRCRRTSQLIQRDAKRPPIRR